MTSHRQRGHELLIITATNPFITRPIAARLGIDELLACEGEIVDGCIPGSPGRALLSRGQGHAACRVAARQGYHLEGAWFYSDSHNDLPLLELVDNPVAVDPDDTLRARAAELGWPIISLRDDRIAESCTPGLNDAARLSAKIALRYSVSGIAG